MDKDFLTIYRMKNGDERAMEGFVRSYYPIILNYCCYHAAVRDFAEDITQETFERFFRALPDYRHNGKALNYLYTIAGNLCKDFYKRERYPEKVNAQAVQEEAAIQKDQAEEAARRMDLERALERLPEELREVIILHYFQDLKLREAAEVLKIGLPLVKYRIKKAKEELASFMEFLCWQLSYIRKRWWMLQFLTLAVLWGILYISDSGNLAQRGMGVLSSAFVTLVIPELWKNRSCGSVEIEGAAFYSLRQVYAARMLLFAMVDAVFLSFFCIAVSATVRITASELIVQFFLPFAVTCCICFGALCSVRFGTEYAAVVLSMLWIAIWVLVILDEAVYSAITWPVWISLLSGACLFMAAAVCRLLRNNVTIQQVCAFTAQTVRK